MGRFARQCTAVCLRTSGNKQIWLESDYKWLSLFYFCCDRSATKIATTQKRESWKPQKHRIWTFQLMPCRSMCGTSTQNFFDQKLWRPTPQSAKCELGVNSPKTRTLERDFGPIRCVRWISADFDLKMTLTRSGFIRYDIFLIHFFSLNISDFVKCF